MQNYLEGLNESQREAVTNYKGASMVIAGAGSGKTRVLTYRIAHLLQSGVKPWSILALTFTNKAAKEMRDRISTLIGSEAASQLWMGTFHSIFSRILRTEGEVLGYDSNFTIYDTSDSRSLIKTIIKDLQLDTQVYKPNVVHARISMAKNNLITHAAYQGNAQLKDRDREQRRPQISDIYKYYALRCKKANAMDFDDLLLNTNILFRDHPEKVEKYQKQFNYLLVDEYQDTNYAQYLIVKRLAERHHNVCVVGDDAQSIYSFRGAKIENILNFKNDYPDYNLYKLEQNYRSTQNIVNAANSIIKKNNGQIKKTVWSDNDEGSKIKVLKAYTDNEEGYLITNDIAESAYSESLAYDDFAILYRTNAQSRIFEETLRKRNIPYKIYGGLSFYQRKEIKDLLAYFRLCVNNNDDEALKRVINYPARGIGATTVGKIEQQSVQNNVSLWSVISDPEKYPVNINKGTAGKINAFVEIITDFTNKLHEKEAYDLGKYIASSTGILKELHNDNAPENVSRYENIQELLNAIREFSEANSSDEKSLTLDMYMENVSLLTDMDNEKEEDNKKVTLMTIHSAKGLEFSHVYIVGVEEELFPSAMSSGSMQDLEEERRLFYVALTRAENKATLSYAETRYKWGSPEITKPSRFIKEIDPTYLDLPEEEEEVSSSFEENLGTKTWKQKKSFKSQTKTIASTAPRSTKGLTSIREAAGKTVQANTTINFTPDDPTKIQSGMSVIHQRFGKGKVLQIEGELPNAKATIFFQSQGQKQLLLRFAKLKIIE